jgi:hypothetical protein
MAAAQAIWHVMATAGQLLTMNVRVDSSPVITSVLGHAELGHAAIAWLLLQS